MTTRWNRRRRRPIARWILLLGLAACEECEDPFDADANLDYVGSMTGVVRLDGTGVPDTNVEVSAGGRRLTSVTNRDGMYDAGIRHGDASFAACARLSGPLGEVSPRSRCASTPDPNGTVTADFEFTRFGPEVAISRPTDGQVFSLDADVVMEAVGVARVETAPFDGDVTTDISWVSSVDGPVGSTRHNTRGETTRRTLRLTSGTHVLTAQVEDRLGSAASDEVTITVAAVANQPPTATISNPADGSSFSEGDAILLTGVALDPEDGSLTGPTLVWTSSVDGAVGSGSSFPWTPSPGTHGLVLTATDSQGATGMDSVGFVVVAANQAPTALITAPPTGSAFITTDAVIFTGTGDDPEDGPLTSTALTWSSSIEGALGTGGSVQRTMAEGVHQITLTATDLQGASGTSVVEITVAAPGTGGTIQGSVTFDGDGLPDIPVALTGTATANTTTNTQGSYSFSNLAAGSYTITITPPPAVSIPTTQTVTLSSGQTLSVNFAG